MLWNNINFWRFAAFALFAAVLVLGFPYLQLEPDFALESSDVQLVDSPEYGARCSFSVSNGGKDGEAYITCHLYLYERGGDSVDDYTVLGINSGETDSGEIFIPLKDGQTVHDWRVEVN